MTPHGSIEARPESLGCGGLRLAGFGLPVSQETARVLVPAEVSCTGRAADTRSNLKGTHDGTAIQVRSGQVLYYSESARIRGHESHKAAWARATSESRRA